MSIPWKYRLLFIDADDTLFDFQQCERNALAKTFRENGIEPEEIFIEKYRLINLEMWQNLEQGFLKQDDIKHERFRILKEHFNWHIDHLLLSKDYIENISEERVLMEGAEEVCQYLSKKYTLVLLTNGISEIQRSRFEGSVLKQYIDKIVISDEACCSKPDPGIYDWSLQGTGFSNKREMLMIGDSLSSDIQGGINFGIDTCWFNPDHKEAGNLKPDFEISGLNDLLKIL